MAKSVTSAFQFLITLRVIASSMCFTLVPDVELAAIARGIGTLKPPQMHHLN